jgi:hypothetical protein
LEIFYVFEEAVLVVKYLFTVLEVFNKDGLYLYQFGGCYVEL